MNEHKYKVTIRVGQNNVAYNVQSDKSLEGYQRALLSGLEGIVTGTTPIGESIHVTSENLVSVEEIIDDVSVGPAEVGDDEQEIARKRELLS